MIATFILMLTATVGSTFAQQRGRLSVNNFERLERRAQLSDTAEFRKVIENIVPESLGNLDVTFGIGGKVTTVLPDDDDPRTIAIQPDGKLVASGIAFDSGGNFASSYVIRHNSNGTVDTGFADNGVFRLNNPNDSVIYGAVALPDGKLLLAADKFDATLNTYDFAAYRLNANGTRDTTFGINGLVTVSLGAGSDEASGGVVVQPDGKFILAGLSIRSGSTSIYDVAAARFNADGTLDNSFGTNGKLVIQVLSVLTQSIVTKVELQADGKILILGYNFVGGVIDTQTFLIRLNANGTFDNTFGTNGIRFSNFNSLRNNTSDLAIQPDGKIIFTSFNFNLASQSFLGSTTVRYNPDGTADTTFGTNGAIFIPISTPGIRENFGASVLLQPSGKIVLGGLIVNQIPMFALLRLNPNGTRDTTFGTNGVVSTALSLNNFVYETVLQPDGKLVALGVVSSSSTALYDVGLARFLLDAPSAPPFFDFDGDSRADLSVFRPSDGIWYRLNSNNNSLAGANWGISTDKIAPADYDGDRKSDLAIYRNGTWYVLQSSNNTAQIYAVGDAGGAIVPGDYDGDGLADVAVFSGGVWRIRQSSNNQLRTQSFGLATDKPIVGDFDADNKQDFAIYRDGNWWIQQSSDNQIRVINFGLATDKPVAADYDGDAKTDFAIYRNGVWWILQSSNNQVRTVNFGVANDKPVPADYDGDSRADIAIYRDGNWWIQRSSSGAISVSQFGLSTDTPVQTAYLP